MTTVDCYNCESPEHSPYCEENGFVLVRCKKRGLLYIRERPSEQEIDLATEAGEHQGDTVLEVNVQYNPFAAAEYRKALAALFGGNFDGVKSWLDVGCGYGEFLETVSKATGGRIEMFGSEPNRVKQASARKRGWNVSYFDLASHTKRYDIVSLMNVYSHLADPKVFIGHMKGVMSEGGRMLIQTGDAAKFSADDILKPLGLPDHLSFASEDILRSLLAQNGLKIDQVYRAADLPLRPFPIAKEFVKMFVPGKQSFFRYYAKWWKYQNSVLYVLASRA